MKKQALIIAFLLGWASWPAQSNIVIDIMQIGPDIVVEGAGSVDTTTITPPAITQALTAALDPQLATVLLGGNGNQSQQVELYFPGPPGPLQFGSGGRIKPVSLSAGGDYFGIAGTAFTGATQSLLLLPENYVSNTPLFNRDVYLGRSFAVNGFTQGSYVYNLPDSQTVTVNIFVVPLPPTLALFGVAGLALIWTKRRQRI